MSETICPICGSNCYITDAISNSYYLGYKCRNTKNPDIMFYIEKSIEEILDKECKEKIYDLIYETLLHEPYYNKNGKQLKWNFYYDENEGNSYFTREKANNINMYFELPKYPKTLMEKTNRVLLNLSVLYPDYGQEFTVFGGKPRAFFHHFSTNGAIGIISALVDMGFVKSEINGYVITAEGWKLIDKLHQEDKEINQGFIAMAFREETKPIREAFRKAIYDCGFTPRVIDEKEHNNQIVPEIFYEIERSKFVVVDVTYQNCGAYYESGYAQALGKQVIICCRKKEFDDPNTRPHFDISQKSMIVWEDETDLVERLKKRIIATVG